MSNSAPTPATRRYPARGAKSATSSRDNSPIRADATVAPAPAGVRSTTESDPDKDKSANADDNTSTKAVDAVAASASAGGDKEHQEKPASGVAHDTKADDGKEPAAGAAPADEAIAVFMKVVYKFKISINCASAS